jgi:Txe/YoeB family toxin of Txe-Axe toxin-antitoxin module
MSLGFAFMLINEKVKEKYDQLLKDVKKGKFDLLDELHHLTSGMKSTFS